jgi:DNA-binding CsgD family transcriptional regulator
MNEDLLDRIYECAFAPEGWPIVIEELSRLIEGERGTLLILGRDQLRWVTVRGGEQFVETMIREGRVQQGRFIEVVWGLRHPGFVSESEVFTPEELDKEPLWRDYYLAHGFAWGAATAVPLPSGERVFLALNRRNELGPVKSDSIQKVDVYRPHLARAILISARLQLERARAVGETLDALGLPGLVLDGQGKVLAANSLVQGLTDYVMWRALNRVSLIDRSAEQLLRDAMAAIDAPQASTRSFPVRHRESGGTMVAHVIPIRLSARDVFVRCAAALVLTPLAAPGAPPVELIQTLFDLTPAEARVARSLTAGDTVEEIASTAGVSANTVRTQVRGVLEKTGCRRQTEVVTLLGGIAASQRSSP